MQNLRCYEFQHFHFVVACSTLAGILPGFGVFCLFGGGEDRGEGQE